MSIGQLILASYYSFFWILVFASIIGAIIVASIDNARVPMGRIAPQH
jgi:hypothetical protein